MKKCNWIVEISSSDNKFNKVYYFQKKSDAQSCSLFFKDHYCDVHMYRLNDEITGFQVFLGFIHSVLLILAVISFFMVIGVIGVYDAGEDTAETLSYLLKWLFIASASGCGVYLIQKIADKLF